MALTGTHELDARDEETLLEELREVAHIDESEDTVVVFASPSETSAIGTQVIQILGGWLLHRRRERREKAAAASAGGPSNLPSHSDTTLAVN